MPLKREGRSEPRMQRVTFLVNLNDTRSMFKKLHQDLVTTQKERDKEIEGLVLVLGKVQADLEHLRKLESEAKEEAQKRHKDLENQIEKVKTTKKTLQTAHPQEVTAAETESFKTMRAALEKTLQAEQAARAAKMQALEEAHAKTKSDLESKLKSEREAQAQEIESLAKIKETIAKMHN